MSFITTHKLMLNIQVWTIPPHCWRWGQCCLWRIHQRSSGWDLHSAGVHLRPGAQRGQQVRGAEWGELEWLGGNAAERGGGGHDREILILFCSGDWYDSCRPDSDLVKNVSHWFLQTFPCLHADSAVKSKGANLSKQIANKSIRSPDLSQLN